MTDTLWADVSEFQRGVNDLYPHRIFAFRSNDGTYRDSQFAHNYQWAVKAANAGKLDAFIVYYVWEDPNSSNVHADMIRAQGGPHPKGTTMQDIESWGNKLRGNHSGPIGKSREDLIKYLYQGNRKKVFNYANEGDRNNLCPSYGDAKWIIANYSYDPKLKDQIGHQYADNVRCAPFGPCDANSADGVAPKDFAAKIGVGGSTPTPPPETDMPKQLYLYSKSGQTTKLAKAGTWVPVNWDPALANTGGVSLALPDSTTLFSMSAWLYFDKLPSDYNMYWRVQTLDRNNKVLSAFPVAEISGTTGHTDLQFSMVGSVHPKTNLRLLVASTMDNTVITNAYWRVFCW